jgi:3-oxoacyl-[acyl-carrier-protein] synthase III
MKLTTTTNAGHARIIGVGAYRPARVVTNAELIDRIDSSDQWIRERTGIIERRWAAPHETVADMAVAAADKALAHAGVDHDQIDMVLVATVTHMKSTPSAGTEVAHRLGMTCAAIDISAACAGFCYGLAMANDLVRSGTARHVLVIGAEKLSDLTHLEDRSTAFLFGDGAGAVVVGSSDTSGIGPVVWGSDGSQLDAITQTVPWTDLRDHHPEAPPIPFPSLSMKGQQVFRWAVWQMAPVAREALNRAGVAPEQLGAFIPHQANMRITDAMIKALKLPEQVPVARDVATSGNTSAASIPLAMDRMLESGQVLSGSPALLIGFGAGLAYAAQVVTLP